MIHLVAVCVCISRNQEKAKGVKGATRELSIYHLLFLYFLLWLYFRGLRRAHDDKTSWWQMHMILWIVRAMLKLKPGDLYLILSTWWSNRGTKRERKSWREVNRRNHTAGSESQLRLNRGLTILLTRDYYTNPHALYFEYLFDIYSFSIGH